MAVSDVLSKFRKSGYPEKSDDKAEEKPSGARVIRLTEDEMQGIQGEPGKEVTITVTGNLEGSEFRVLRVEGAGDGGMEKEMAAEVMGQPPIMRQGTAPYPS